MVDDGVDHDAVGLGKFGDIVPAAEARVDLGVVDGVEACIRAVEWSENGRICTTSYTPSKRVRRMSVNRAEGAVAEAIGVGDELHFVFHGILPWFMGAGAMCARLPVCCLRICYTHVCIEPVRYYLERDVNVQSRSEMRVSNRLDAVFYAA